MESYKSGSHHARLSGQWKQCHLLCGIVSEKTLVEGTKVKTSLSLLEKKNSRVESYLIRDLMVSDLDENDFISLPALYTRPVIPVCEEDIPI